MSLAARAVLALVLLALAGAAGWRQGVKATLADWHAADLARERAAAELVAEQQRLAGRAAQRHEAERAAIITRLEESRHAIANALRRPAPNCGPGGAGQPVPELGQLVLPAGSLAGVRHAAGAGAAAPAAAGEPGAAVPAGPADPGE